MDLMIELTKLFTLHEAATKLDHAVRESGVADLEWRPFSPSKFIYAYFACNSIYAIDWKESIEAKCLLPWELTKKKNSIESKCLLQRKSTENRKHPEEADQIKALVQFSCEELGSQAPQTYRRILERQLQDFGIAKPINAMQNIRSSNESKRAKGLRKAFPGNLKTLLETENLTEASLRSSLCGALSYIQAVRNNVFHGSKTSIEMHDPLQQTRLLVYTAIVSSLCELFFCAIECVLPDWKRVPADFARTARESG